MGKWQMFFRDARDVFRRHWKLLVLPIPLALLITVWIVVSTPTMYQSNAAIWSGTPPALPSAPVVTDPTQLLAPAAQQQSLLNELLATDQFRTSVTSGGPLAAWVASHSPSTLTPSGLWGLLHGAPSVPDRISSALVSGTSTAVLGPHVLAVSFQAQTPTAAHDTLAALLTTFATQRATLVPAATQGTFRILDVPSTPGGPTSGAAKSLTTIIAGLLAGAIVTILAVAILVLVGDGKRRTAAHDEPEGNRTAEDGAVIPGAAAAAVTVTPSVHETAEIANGTARPAAQQTIDDEQRVTGIVRDVRLVRNAGARRVVWVVSTDADISPRSRVMLDKAPGGEGTVVRVEETPDGVDLFVELSAAAANGAHGAGPAASDSSWIGQVLTLTADDAALRDNATENSRA